MFAVAIILALILGVIWWLTAPQSPKLHNDSLETSTSDVAADTFDLISREGPGLPALDGAIVGEILLDLFDRMGLSRQEGADAVRGMGFRVSPETANESSGSDGSFEPGVVSYHTMAVRATVERGLLVGIELARRDDDYGSVGDAAFDESTLAADAERIGRELFDEQTRRRQVFFSRAVVALQDMVQNDRDDDRRRTVGAVLDRFGNALDEFQQMMDERMADVDSDGELQWGDSADRRLYYFKMGVTNSLRRSGRIDSLGHLYRYQGVNYDVTEAYDLASQEVPALRQAEELGIGRVLALRPDEVHALVGRGLPAGPHKDSIYDGES